MGSRCRIDVNSLEDAIMIMFTTRGTDARIMAQKGHTGQKGHRNISAKLAVSPS